jgi:hypothetical protein
MTNSNSNEYFQKILKVVNEAKQSGLISKGSGYCFSMSDIILKLLYKEGVKSKLVECSLMVTYKNPPGMYLMGYPGFNQNNYDADTMMQTHIVCVTESEIPILFDASIAHIDKNVPFICAPLNTVALAKSKDFIFSSLFIIFCFLIYDDGVVNDKTSP